MIKYLLNRRANKKKENAEADKELVSLQDSRYSEILQSYKDEVINLKEQVELCQERMKDKSLLIQELEEKMTSLVENHQQLVESKNSQIESLMRQINDLTSSVTGLTLLRCVKTECPVREPKLASTLQIKNGLLVSNESE